MIGWGGNPSAGRLGVTAQPLEQALKRAGANRLGRLGEGGDAVAHQRVPVKVIQGNQAHVVKQVAA